MIPRGSVHTDFEVELGIVIGKTAKYVSQEEALDYAKDNGIDAQVCEPHKRKPNLRARGYGENFATDRRAPWTH